MRLILRSLGWVCISLGFLVALYLVYSLYWTGLQTSRAQEQLLGDWVLEVGEIDGPAASTAPAGTGAEALEPVELGDAVAALQFHRPSTGERPVYDDPLLIVEGVTEDVLQSGPGHYPTSAQPGQMGNFAVAGHRTTFGAPFYDLETLLPGDHVLVTDRNGQRWTYEVLEQRVVAPTDTDVLRRDPLGTGRPMLTLTTCNPRWSNRERLVVLAQLVDDQLDEVLAVSGGPAGEPA